jgi:hypothetical protein
MPTYCTLADAYGPSWGSQPNKVNDVSAVKKYENVIKQADTAPRGEDITLKVDDVKSGCPNCQHCLNQNNQFQQKVIDQSVRPLPRWVPQESTMQNWDPFNRHFAQHNENFGNVGNFGNFGNNVENFGNISTNNASHLIQLVLYLLIALFMIQLLELITSIN